MDDELAAEQSQFGGLVGNDDSIRHARIQNGSDDVSTIPTVVTSVSGTERVQCSAVGRRDFRDQFRAAPYLAADPMFNSLAR